MSSSPYRLQRAAASSELNYFLSTYLQPCDWSLHRRRHVFQYVERSIRESAGCLGMGYKVDVFLFGSLSLSTFLPDGDIDITVKCPLEDVASLMTRVHTDLLRNNVNVTFVQAEVKLFKCVIDNIIVVVSFNQLTGVAAGKLVHEADGRMPSSSHLLKKSLLLVKAWAYYEARMLGARGGLLGTYALTVMLLTVMNEMAKSRELDMTTTPLDVLISFLNFYAALDISTHVITIYGCVPISQEVPPSVDDRGCVVDMAFLAHFRNKMADFVTPRTASAPSSPRPSVHNDDKYSPYTFDPRDRPVNISDPLRTSNNVGKGVHQCHAVRIQLAFRKAAVDLGNILTEYAHAGGQETTPCILRFFEKTVRAVGGTPNLPSVPPPPALPLQLQYHYNVGPSKETRSMETRRSSVPIQGTNVNSLLTMLLTTATGPPATSATTTVMPSSLGGTTQPLQLMPTTAPGPPATTAATGPSSMSETAQPMQPMPTMAHGPPATTSSVGGTTASLPTQGTKIKSLLDDSAPPLPIPTATSIDGTTIILSGGRLPVPVPAASVPIQGTEINSLLTMPTTATGPPATTAADGVMPSLLGGTAEPMQKTRKNAQPIQPMQPMSSPPRDSS